MTNQIFETTEFGKNLVIEEENCRVLLLVEPNEKYFANLESIKKEYEEAENNRVPTDIEKMIVSNKAIVAGNNDAASAALSSETMIALRQIEDSIKSGS